MPSRVGTDRDSVRSLRSGIWVENPEVETDLDRFQETIPALSAIKRAQPNESQPMIARPDTHEPLLRRRKPA
jgi:hypothetical protein